jgi:PmbA protein
MTVKELMACGLEQLRAAGADCARVEVRETEMSELTVAGGSLELFRTIANTQLSLTAYSGERKGSAISNQADRASVRAAADEAMSLARASEPDSANAIAPPDAKADFTHGDAGPDAPAMYDRLREFLEGTSITYPKIRLDQTNLDFTKTVHGVANSNGVLFEETTGVYAFFTVFTSKDGAKTSSFNYSGAIRRKLDVPLRTLGSIDTLLRQSGEQLASRSVPGSFVGSVILTPDCVGDIIGMLEGVCLGSPSLIRGSSPYKDKLGQQVAVPGLSLHARPVSPEMQDGYSFTPDGFRAADAPIIENGLLRNFTLDLYGANKTGKRRSPNCGGCWVVDPGDASLPAMIGSVARGLLLCRLSGGRPSENGDFSGVAKNSYLIENGAIAWPLGETMISGNLVALLRSIEAISRERVDFGTSLLPWIQSGGITISGK